MNSDSSLAFDKEMAVLSRSAYDGIFDKKYNTVAFFEDKETSTQAYLVSNEAEKIAVLTFRGTTKDYKDILSDIKFGKKKHQGRWIHRGFLTSYLSVKDVIDKETNYIPKGYRFYLTGHSLGGALACLQALYGAVPSDKIVTFGQPRLGRQNLAKALSKLHYVRYVNHADLIARMPKINYYHGGHLIYINDKGKRVHNPSRWNMFKDRLFSFFHRFTDHKINNYIKRGMNYV